MADAQDDDDEIFVYMGGDQQVPRHIRRARIHKSVKIVRARAFLNRFNLISVEFHDGVEIIEAEAFYGCVSLKGPIKLPGIKIIEKWAFNCCTKLTDVEFGDKLETIEDGAFNGTALTNIKIPSVTTVGRSAFANCRELIDVECGEGLRTLEERAFANCRKLERIALPLKDNMIEDSVFEGCFKLQTIDLVGGIHQTVASLHFESWRNEMSEEINRINQVLPAAPYFKTGEVQQWMRTVSRRLNHYKAQHLQLLKEATTLLELALWKTNLDDNKGDRLVREGVRTTRGSRKRARKEICVTSGASIVIRNVLPFLALK